MANFYTKQGFWSEHWRAALIFLRARAGAVLSKREVSAIESDAIEMSMLPCSHNAEQKICGVQTSTLVMSELMFHMLQTSHVFHVALWSWCSMLPCCHVAEPKICGVQTSTLVMSELMFRMLQTSHVSHVAVEPCFACCTVIMMQHVAMLPCCRAKNMWCSNFNFSDV